MRSSTITFGYQPKASGKDTGCGPGPAPGFMRLTPGSRAPAKADPSARAGFEFDPGGLHLGRGCAYLGLGWRHLGGFSLAYVVTIVAFCRLMWPPSWHMRAICWSILAPILAQRSHSRVSRRTEIRRPRARYQRSFAWCCRCCCGCGRCCCRGHGCCCVVVVVVGPRRAYVGPSLA